MKTTESVSRKAEDTMTSTERCGPLLCEGGGGSEGMREERPGTGGAGGRWRTFR